MKGNGHTYKHGLLDIWKQCTTTMDTHYCTMLKVWTKISSLYLDHYLSASITRFLDNGYVTWVSNATDMWNGELIFIVYDFIFLDICSERSEVTLYFRPFIFYGIPRHLISLHGIFSRTGRRRWVGWRDELLLDGYIYPDSN